MKSGSRSLFFYERIYWLNGIFYFITVRALKWMFMSFLEICASWRKKSICQFLEWWSIDFCYLFTVESPSFRGIENNAHACHRSWNCCYHEQGTLDKFVTLKYLVTDSPSCCCVIIAELYFDCSLQHRWRVGIMTEMAPIGYVGISPKCILGLNKVMTIINISIYCISVLFSLIFCPLLTLIFAESWRGDISAS